MNPFKPPITTYTDYFDVEKFNFSWVAFQLLSVTLAALAVMFYFNGNSNYIVLSAAFVLHVGMLVTLYLTRSYKLVAILIGILGIVVLQLSIYWAENSYRFTDLLYIFLLCIYLLYTLGALWGVLSFMINLTGLLGFVFFVKDDAMLPSLTGQTIEAKIDLIVNSVVTISTICYLLYKIMSHAEIAQVKYRKAYEEVQQSNEEKTVLLMEIHHRVKNNLQVVSSLLRLQASRSALPEVEAELKQAVNRVTSMGLIHQKMYQSKSLAEIDLEEYLKSLIAEVVGSQADGECEVKTDIKSEVQQVNIPSLVPLALIFNELVTNSLKHGFKGRSEGKININIRRKGKETHIEYSDSGSWKEPDRSKSSGLGSTIIDAFTEQLEGAFEVARDLSGTRYRFVFNEFL